MDEVFVTSLLPRTSITLYLSSARIVLRQQFEAKSQPLFLDSSSHSLIILVSRSLTYIRMYVAV